MPRAPHQFRVHAKNLFLTYPQCQIPKDTVLQQIISIECNSDKKYIRVARELHEDGQPHLHVLIQFEAKIQICNPRHFDLTHHSRTSGFHPHIQGAESSSDIKSYIDKDGDYIEWGQFQTDPRSARGGYLSNKDAYAEALKTGSKQSALDTLRELAPWYYISQLHNINAKLDRVFAPPLPVYKSKWDPNSFVIPDALQRWIGEYFIENAPGKYILNRNIDRPMSIIIEGPTRIGKTEWARSLGSHNYLSGYLDLNPREFSDNVEYNVIDNISPTSLKLKYWKELLGAQRDWQSSCKYGRRVQMKGGFPSIVLCNPGQGFSYKDFLDKEKNAALKEWTIKHVWFVETNTLFYQTTTQEGRINS